MNAITLEQYFIEDYKRLKIENDGLKTRLAAFEANAGNHEYGITDLHQRTKAVRGEVISAYYVRCRLKDGKLKEADARGWLELDDEALFERVAGRSVDYSTILKYEEHEFQYMLFVKESRTEWTAVSDWKKNSNLLEINDGEFDESSWFAVDRADEFKAWLLGELRDNIREALDNFEQEQAKKDGDAE